MWSRTVISGNLLSDDIQADVEPAIEVFNLPEVAAGVLAIGQRLVLPEAFLDALRDGFLPAIKAFIPGQRLEEAVDYGLSHLAVGDEVGANHAVRLVHDGDQINVLPVFVLLESLEAAVFFHLQHF
jgi:hypothetical protein